MVSMDNVSANDIGLSYAVVRFEPVYRMLLLKMATKPTSIRQSCSTVSETMLSFREGTYFIVLFQSPN